MCVCEHALGRVRNALSHQVLGPSVRPGGGGAQSCVGQDRRPSYGEQLPAPLGGAQVTRADPQQLLQVGSALSRR